MRRVRRPREGGRRGRADRPDLGNFALMAYAGARLDVAIATWERAYAASTQLGTARHRWGSRVRHGRRGGCRNVRTPVTGRGDDTVRRQSPSDAAASYRPLKPWTARTVAPPRALKTAEPWLHQPCRRRVHVPRRLEPLRSPERASMLAPQPKSTHNTH